MTKILIELEKSDNTTELIKKGTSAGFARFGAEVRCCYESEINEEMLNWCDVCYAVRPNTPTALSVADSIKKSGRFYIAYFDDDLMNLTGTLLWRRKCSRKCIEKSDVVISTSPLLAEEYGKMTETGRSHISGTVVLESEIKALHKIGKKIRFVYAAGRDHELFFEKLVLPSLHKILEKYHDSVHFTFIGVQPNVKELGYPECFDFVGLMPLDQYEQYMLDNDFDIGLSPLEDNYFNNRKYFNKFIEYSKCGIIGLYSNCKPYTYIVEDGINGYLVNNTAEEWFAALENVIDNSEKLTAVAENAQNALRRRLTIEAIDASTLEEIPELTTFDCDIPLQFKKSSAQSAIFTVSDKIVKLINQLKTRGIGGTYKFIVNYIKDHMRGK